MLKAVYDESHAARSWETSCLSNPASAVAGPEAELDWVTGKPNAASCLQLLAWQRQESPQCCSLRQELK